MQEPDAPGAELEAHAPAEGGYVRHTHRNPGLVDARCTTGTQHTVNVPTLTRYDVTRLVNYVSQSLLGESLYVIMMCYH